MGKKRTEVRAARVGAALLVRGDRGPLAVTTRHHGA